MSVVAKVPLADALKTLFVFVQCSSRRQVTFYTQRLIQRGEILSFSLYLRQGRLRNSTNCLKQISRKENTSFNPATIAVVGSALPTIGKLFSRSRLT